MNRKTYIITAAFTAFYAVFISLCACCSLQIVGGLLVRSAFNEPFLSVYPRFAPFCIASGAFSFIIFCLLIYFDVRLSKKNGSTRLLQIIKASCAVCLSFPLLILWEMLFDHLQAIF